jgi:hypothetical protein
VWQFFVHYIASFFAWLPKNRKSIFFAVIRQPNAMPRLSDLDRGRAIGMLDAGISQRRVAVALHVHECTISRLKTRYHATGSTKDRKRSGRPRVTNVRQDRYIVLQHLHA